MKQFLLSVTLLIGAAVNAQDCSDLFISEYVEGWGNNKALEIYNPTSQAIDLSGYLIQRYNNGATSAGAQASVQLSGTIEPYSTYVAVIDKRDPDGDGQEAPVWDELQAKADGFYCPDYDVSYAMYFNGNDAVVLAKGSISDLASVDAVDIFGKIGEDPDAVDCGFGANETCGWTTVFPFTGTNGTVVTTDHSLIRLSTVLKGEIDPAISHFNPLAEYDSIPAVVTDESTGNLVGNWESLGTHNCECDPQSSVEKKALIKISIYPNPSESGEFTLETDNGIKKLEVLNTLGKSILVKHNLNASSVINIGDNTGVYFVKIETEDGGVSSRKVIVR